jgi:hypothetical protein
MCRSLLAFARGTQESELSSDNLIDLAAHYIAAGQHLESWLHCLIRIVEVVKGGVVRDIASIGDGVTMLA